MIKTENLKPLWHMVGAVAIAGLGTGVLRHIEVLWAPALL